MGQDLKQLTLTMDSESMKLSVMKLKEERDSATKMAQVTLPPSI
jgi:hypothetical protein